MSRGAWVNKWSSNMFNSGSVAVFVLSGGRVQVGQDWRQMALAIGCFSCFGAVRTTDCSCREGEAHELACLLDQE